MPRVRPESALILIFLFVPLMTVYLSLRDWRQYRDMQWPPPLSLPIGGSIVLVLVCLFWWSVTVP